MKEILGEKYYTRKEVADMLGVSPNFIIKETLKGKIKAVRIGQIVCVSETAIRDYMRAHTLSPKQS